MIERAEPAHLLMEQADGVGRGIVGAKGVGADQLGERLGLVRLGAADGPHLVQHDGDTRLGDLPRGLGTGEAAADDVNRAGLAR